MGPLETDVLDIGFLSGGATDGFPLVLLHGWPDDPTGWEKVTPMLEKAGYRWIAPWLRGFGHTSFRFSETLRDGSSVALAQDALDIADALELKRFAVVGHDWGGRAAYALAALAPERVAGISSLAIGYAPRGTFVVPHFAQCERWWYQWLMTSDAGAQAVRADPIGFARRQWETWSPPGWFDDDAFLATARSFANPDWIPITLHGYRHRWQPERLDRRYDVQRARISATEQIAVPTLMLQGGDDRCDPPSESEGQGRWFTGGYERQVIGGVGHFPAREAPAEVGEAVLSFLSRIVLEP